MVYVIPPQYDSLNIENRLIPNLGFGASQAYTVSLRNVAGYQANITNATVTSISTNPSANPLVISNITSSSHNVSFEISGGSNGADYTLTLGAVTGINTYVIPLQLAVGRIQVGGSVIALQGAVNGSGQGVITTTLAPTGVTPGSYNLVTVGSDGRVTYGVLVSNGVVVSGGSNGTTFTGNAVYANSANIALYANTAGTAGYATTAGSAAYATSAASLATPLDVTQISNAASVVFVTNAITSNVIGIMSSLGSYATQTYVGTYVAGALANVVSNGAAHSNTAIYANTAGSANTALVATSVNSISEAQVVTALGFNPGTSNVVLNATTIVAALGYIPGTSNGVVSVGNATYANISNFANFAGALTTTLDVSQITNAVSNATLAAAIAAIPATTSVANATHANTSDTSTFATSAGQANTVATITLGQVTGALGFNPGTSNVTASFVTNSITNAINAIPPTSVPVQSVAGQTGNVVLSVTDVANAASVPYVGTYVSAALAPYAATASLGSYATTSSLALANVANATHANTSTFATNAGSANSATSANTVVTITAAQIDAALGFNPGTSNVVLNSVTVVSALGYQPGTSNVVLTGSNVITALGFTPVNNAAVGAVSGLATLDSTGHLTTGQIPSSLIGALNYQGTWDAYLNVPTLVSGSGTKGYYYQVANAGSTSINGISTWNLGDLIAYQGLGWEKIDGVAAEVISVSGRTGVITLSVTDVANAASTTYVGTYVSAAIASIPGVTSVANATYANTAGTSSFAATAGSANSAVVANTVNTITSTQVTTALGFNPGTSNVVLNATTVVAALGFNPGTSNGVSVPVQSVAGRIGNVVLSVTDVANAVSNATLATYASQTFVGTYVTNAINAIPGVTSVANATYANTSGFATTAGSANSAVVANTVTNISYSQIQALGFTPLTSASIGVALGYTPTNNAIIGSYVLTSTLAGSDATQSYVGGYVANNIATYVTNILLNGTNPYLYIDSTLNELHPPAGGNIATVQLADTEGNNGRLNLGAGSGNVWSVASNSTAFSIGYNGTFVPVVINTNGVVIYSNTITTITQPTADSTTNVATTAFVHGAIVSAAPTSVANATYANTAGTAGFATTAGSANTAVQASLVNTITGAQIVSGLGFVPANNAIMASYVTITSLATASVANATYANSATNAIVANTVNTITSTQVTTALGFNPGTSNATNTVTVALTGAITGTGTGNNISIATTLANSGVTAGTYGSASYVPQIVVGANGIVTSVSNVAVAGGGGSSTFAVPVTMNANATVTNTISLTSATNTTTQINLMNGTNILWQIGTIGNQTGSNKGANLAITSYFDNGVAYGMPMINISRATIPGNTNYNGGVITLAANTVIQSGAQGGIGPFSTINLSACNGTMTDAGGQINLTGWYPYVTIDASSGTAGSPTLTLNRYFGGPALQSLILSQTSSYNNWGLVLGDGNSYNYKGDFTVYRYAGSFSSTLTDIPFRISIQTGMVTMADGATANGVYINGANASTTRTTTYQTNSVTRFVEGLSQTAETGNSVGSDYLIQAWNDAGNVAVNAVTIYRSNAVTKFGNTITTVTQPAGDRTTNVATTAFVQSGTFTWFSLNWTTNYPTAYITGTSGDAVIVMQGGSPLHGGANLTLSIGNTNSSTGASIYFQNAQTNRWTLNGTTTAETGANQGSNLTLAAYSDAGTLLQNTVTIYRNNSVAAFSNTITTVTQPVGDNTTNVATTAFVQNTVGSYAIFTPVSNGTMTIPLGVTYAIISNSTGFVSNVALSLPTPTVPFTTLRIAGVGAASSATFGNYIGAACLNLGSTANATTFGGGISVGQGNYTDFFWAQNQWNCLLTLG